MIFYLIVIILAVLLSAFFSSSEIAINSLNPARLKKAIESGDKAAKVALELSENFTSTLCTILIGNNLVNTAATTAATVVILNFMAKRNFAGADELAPVLTTVIMTVIILIFGEIIPKILSKQNADTVVRIIALISPPRTDARRVIKPLNSHIFANTSLNAKDEYGPTLSNRPAIGGVTSALNGLFSSFTIVFASLPTAVCTGGVEECPPIICCVACAFTSCDNIR